MEEDPIILSTPPTPSPRWRLSLARRKRKSLSDHNEQPVKHHVRQMSNDWSMVFLADIPTDGFDQVQLQGMGAQLSSNEDGVGEDAQSIVEGDGAEGGRDRSLKMRIHIREDGENTNSGVDTKECQQIMSEAEESEHAADHIYTTTTTATKPTHTPTKSTLLQSKQPSVLIEEIPDESSTPPSTNTPPSNNLPIIDNYFDRVHRNRFHLSQLLPRLPINIQDIIPRLQININDIIRQPHIHAGIASLRCLFIRWFRRRYKRLYAYVVNKSMDLFITLMFYLGRAMINSMLGPGASEALVNLASKLNVQYIRNILQRAFAVTGAVVGMGYIAFYWPLLSAAAAVVFVGAGRNWILRAVRGRSVGNGVAGVKLFARVSGIVLVLAANYTVQRVKGWVRERRKKKRRERRAVGM